MVLELFNHTIIKDDDEKTVTTLVVGIARMWHG